MYQYGAICVRSSHVWRKIFVYSCLINFNPWTTSYLGGDCGGGSWRGGIQKVLLLGQNGRQCDHFTVAVHYHVKCVMLLSCYPPDHCLYRLGPAPRCHQCHISHTDAFVISLALYSDQSSFHPRRRNFWNNCWHIFWYCWLIWKGTILLSCSTCKHGIDRWSL